MSYIPNGHLPVFLNTSTAATVSGMENDAAFKEIFSHSVMVRALVEWYVDRLPNGPELTASLDLSRLQRSVEQSVSEQGRRFARDMVWQAPFRPRPDGSEDARERLLLPLEFQRAPERIMPLRMRNYVDGHYLEHIKEASGKPLGGRLPPVLPIVLHTGRSAWHAPPRVHDLVAGLPEKSWQQPNLHWPDSGLLSGDGYLVLDIPRVSAKDFRDDNAMSLLAQLTASFAKGPATPEFFQTAAKLYTSLPGAELRGLRETILQWVLQETNVDLGTNDMDTLDRLQDPEEAETFMQYHARMWRTRYREEGLEIGRAEGIRRERELLHGLTSRKFDPRTAERLSALLAGANASRLAEVGNWLIDSDTGEELIARVSGTRNGR
ncbi:MAG: Rpn family recombination-promoting nuclease/putative transposase [Gammaproteobacteria bacterium]|nr:Rpn family recombination-promoting nuclease/putative transposase [Gammaproteobacteria bacterium]